MLSGDDILQQNTGSFEGTSGTVTLPGGTTAGSMVLVTVAVADPTAAGIAAANPTGGAGSFSSLDQCYLGGTGRAGAFIFTQAQVAAGESSWTLPTTGASAQVCWAAFEFKRVGSPLADKWIVTDALQSGANVTGAVRPSFTTAQAPPVSQNTVTESFDTLVLGVFAAVSTSTTIPTFTSYSSGFYEWVTIGRANATNGVALSVAFQPAQHLDTFTATANVTPDSYTSGCVAAFYADDGHWAPNYALIFGAELGTATGLSSGSTATGITSKTSPFDAVVGTPAIVSTFKRSGSYSLQLSSSAAAECVTNTRPATGHGTLLDGSAVSGPRTLVERRHFYFDTTAPAADTELFSVEIGSLANGMTVWYRAASQKIGVKIGTGTEVLSDATIPVNKWIGLDWRYDPRTTTHLVDWQVDYDSLDTSAAPVTQTQASTAAMTIIDDFTIVTSRTGWTTSKTATVYYDDFVWSWFWGTYPIGDVRIVPLGVDQTGTPAVTGTSANFQSFASNGTGSAFNAATVRAALADTPPVIGGSSAGLMQITAASTDYVTVPMETYTAAPLYAPRAVRWYIAGWAASSTAATLNVTSFDGSNKMMDICDPQTGGATVALDHNFDNAALVWLCAMERSSLLPMNVHLLDQTKVDALAIRMGYSTDATPDIGIHNVLAELAVATADVLGIADVEGSFFMYTRQDPKTYATISLQGATPPGTRGLTMTWTVDGVDGSQYVGPNTTGEVSLGCADITHITAIGLQADNP